jgi:WD40 repeat protein
MIPGEDIVYTEKIVSMDVSPDDKRIATLNNDSQIKIWDAQTGSQVLEITAERQSDSLTYDASGRRLISWGFGETIEVWDALDGTRINRFAPEKGPAQAAKPILITPDGAGLVAGLQDGTVRVWDLASGVEIRKIVLDEAANSIALSPDGDWLITASENKARVWNMHTGQKMAHLAHQGEVTSAEMSMDGNLVVTTSADGRAHMWLWKFADLIQLACRRLPRDLTRDEWLHYLGDQVEYEPTCPGLL